MNLPKDTAYGIQTARALQNFPITGVPLGHFLDLVQALAMAKKAATLANLDRGARPLAIAAQHHAHFVADMIQGGVGTFTNMNANDVCPTALRLATLRACEPLLRAQKRLGAAFAERAEAFKDIQKVGRTQLQDAVPITPGMEFMSISDTIKEDIALVRQLSALLTKVNLGGTAVGGYSALAVKHLSDVSGHTHSEAANRIEGSTDLGAFVMFSSMLRRIVIKTSKICTDLRLLSSGPRAGFGEILLPAMQAGSSIMPGKVNPVIPEVVNQIACQIIGNDLTVTRAAEAGQLRSNAMEPVLIFNILQSLRILIRWLEVLADRCVARIEADVARCEELLSGSLVLVTALVPHIGYEASKIAKLALLSRCSIAEVAVETGFVRAEDLDSILSPTNMLGASSEMAKAKGKSTK